MKIEAVINPCLTKVGPCQGIIARSRAARAMANSGVRIALTVTFLLFASAVNTVLAQSLSSLPNLTTLSTLGYPSAMARGSDGNFYGTTVGGGTGNAGTVFKMTPAGVVTTLYNFCSQTNCADGAAPSGGLVQGSDGSFYGTTANGGVVDSAESGSVFEITPTGGLTPLYGFCEQSNCPDGDHPDAKLVLASNGQIYGTTAYGGARGYGTVFVIVPEETRGGTEFSLYTQYSFCAQSNCADGSFPNALIQGSDGNFYGTTSEGGANNHGTVFQITPAGVLTVLYSFCAQSDCPDGLGPSAGLVQASDGNFYGTTIAGGVNRLGTVFKITATGALNTLYSFCSQSTQTISCSDGAYPAAALVQANDGNLYGTTSGESGGPSSAGPGTIFKITPAGVLTTLYNFCALTNCADGENPGSALLPASNGNFYGTTSGTIFSLAVFAGSAALGSQADYVGTGQSEITVWRPSTGTWYCKDNAGNVISRQWGVAGDTPVQGDFDGDGKTDFAVYRASAGYWYIIESKTGHVTSQQWGQSGDVPVPGDYDGDGKTDIAVWRPSDGNWYIIPSSNPSVPIVRQWGARGDVPVPGDYDGDGRTDIAVWRSSSGTWYMIQSATNQAVSVQWGKSGDIPVPHYYEGRGNADLAVWRPSNGTWYVLQNSTHDIVTRQWGQTGDIPVARDYDGDGRTDFAVWRPSTGRWYILSSGTNEVLSPVWGASTDIPVNKPLGQ